MKVQSQTAQMGLAKAHDLAGGSVQTLFGRLKFVINVIMEPSGNYLKSNIEQARLFLDSYRDLLSHEKLNDIKFIISLSNISQFIRMIKIAIYKYFFRKIRINFRLN